MFTVRFKLSNGHFVTRVGVTLDELPYSIDSLKRDCHPIKIKDIVLIPVGGFIQ